MKPVGMNMLSNMVFVLVIKDPKNTTIFSSQTQIKRIKKKVSIKWIWD